MALPPRSAGCIGGKATRGILVKISKSREIQTVLPEDSSSPQPRQSTPYRARTPPTPAQKRPATRRNGPAHVLLPRRPRAPPRPANTPRTSSPSNFPFLPLDNHPPRPYPSTMQLASTPVPQPSPNLPPAVAKLSHSHDAILNWLLLNPCATLRECGDQLGYSVPWLSRLIHTDIFQAELAARQGEVFVAVSQDIPQKLRGLADIAIEKVTEQLLSSESPQFTLEVFDKTLTKLGYAPQSQRQPGAGGTTNVFMVNAGDLAAARGVMTGAAVQGDVYEQFCAKSDSGALVESPALPQGLAAQGQEVAGGSL